jgi:hypothetical protein
MGLDGPPWVNSGVCKALGSPWIKLMVADSCPTAVFLHIIRLKETSFQRLCYGFFEVVKAAQRDKQCFNKHTFTHLFQRKESQPKILLTSDISACSINSLKQTVWATISKYYKTTFWRSPKLLNNFKGHYFIPKIVNNGHYLADRRSGL